MIRLKKICKGENKMKSNRGITLIALAITIIILIILASVGTYSGISALRNSKENAQISEIGMVQQAVVESYTKYEMVKDMNENAAEQYLIGQQMNYSDVQDIVDEINSKRASTEEKVTLKVSADYGNVEGTTEKQPEYYYLLGVNDLEKIGISQAEGDTYIVNYLTGEVINQELLVTGNGIPLYIYAYEGET